MIGLIMSLVSAVLFGVFITTYFICDHNLGFSKLREEQKELIKEQKELQQEYRRLNKIYEEWGKNPMPMPDIDK